MLPAPRQQFPCLHGFFCKFFKSCKVGSCSLLSSFSPKLPQFGTLTERNKKSHKKTSQRGIFQPQNSPDEILSTKNTALLIRQRNARWLQVFFISELQPVSQLLLYNYSWGCWIKFDHSAFGKPIAALSFFPAWRFWCPRLQTQAVLSTAKELSTIPRFYLSPHTELTQAGIKNPKPQPSWHTWHAHGCKMANKKY